MAKKTLNLTNLTNLTTSVLANLLGACPEYKTRTKKYGDKLIKTVWEQEATEEDMEWLVNQLEGEFYVDVAAEEVEVEQHDCNCDRCEYEVPSLDVRNSMLARYPWVNIEKALKEAAVLVLDMQKEKNAVVKDLIKQAQKMVTKLSDPAVVEKLTKEDLECLQVDDAGVL